MPTTLTASNVGLQSGQRKAMEPAWHLTRTLRGGTVAMREARATYTPWTKKEERRTERYEARLKRTVLFPIYDQTLRKLASLPFQKAPTMAGEMPASVVALVADADRMGTTLASFAREIYTDAIDKGVGMFLVDSVPTVGLNQAEADAADARPYFRRVVPDNLLRCEVEWRSGREVPVLFAFRTTQWITVGVADVMSTRVEAWSEDHVEHWANTGPGTAYAKISEQPNTLGKIPLVTVYTSQLGSCEGRPALESLAWLNVSHWNSLSMQTEALHYCRSPILKVTGTTTDPRTASPELGPGAVMTDENENANVAFVEIAGTSLAAGEVEIQKIEQRCQAIGMQPLVSVSGPMTATGEVIADTNQKSDAQSWIESLEWAVWRGIEFVARWANETLPEDGDWTLYRDSSVIAGKAADLPNIFSALREGIVTRETALRELVLRGVIATVEDPAQELAALQLEADQQQQNQLAMVTRQIGAERATSTDPAAAAPPEAAVSSV